MKKHFQTIVTCLLISFIVSACGPGQLFGPTFTSTPSSTLTPTSTVTPTSTPIPTLTPRPSLTPTFTPESACTEAGCSFETAVVIEADNESDGIAMEYQWLADHYPGYQNISQAISFDGNKIYDVLTIITADGVEKTIYFDITLFYGHF
ncbi:MAG: hypothetical protein ACOYZ6_03655 [Chloroflexota bacterium]